MTHRLFFGIKPPAPVRHALLERQHGVVQARWQNEEQLHLTLQFLGDVEPPLADDLAHHASRLSFAPFEISEEGAGLFERKGVPRLLYARVRDCEPLASLQKKIARLVHDLGIATRERSFTPHITLARLNTSSGPVTSWLSQNAELCVRPWQVDSFILYESHLGATGSHYEPVSIYPAHR